MTTRNSFINQQQPGDPNVQTLIIPPRINRNKEKLDTKLVNLKTIEGHNFSITEEKLFPFSHDFHVIYSDVFAPNHSIN